MTIQILEMPEYEGPDDDFEQRIEYRIKHILTIYPCISPSMLQIGLGSGIPADLWKPVLDKLVERGVVQKTFVAAVTPNGRQQTVTVLKLSETTTSM